MPCVTLSFSGIVGICPTLRQVGFDHWKVSDGDVSEWGMSNMFANLHAIWFVSSVAWFSSNKESCRVLMNSWILDCCWVVGLLICCAARFWKFGHNYPHPDRYRNWWALVGRVVVNIPFILDICSGYFYTLHHGKSPSNHHLGWLFLLLWSILSKSKFLSTEYQFLNTQISLTWLTKSHKSHIILVLELVYLINKTLKQLLVVPGSSMETPPLAIWPNQSLHRILNGGGWWFFPNLPYWDVHCT